MPTKPPPKRRASSSASSPEPSTKRAKPTPPTTKTKRTTTTRTASQTTPQTSPDRVPFWPLNPQSTRRITLSTYKTQPLVSIREYYADAASGAMQPGKKGISLTLEQLGALVGVLPGVLAEVRRGGGAVDTGGVVLVTDGEEGEAKRKNYEATSSEDDG